MRFIDMPVLRAVKRLGVERTVRIAALIAVVWALIEVVAVLSPASVRPTDLGSDTSNYLAASERLIDHDPVYALSPGDRPAPADNPPFWTVPILSPPTLPVLLLPLALAPEPAGMLLFWSACFAFMTLFMAAVSMRAPIAALLLISPLIIEMAITAWSGNVNALVPAAGIATWIAARPVRETRGISLMAGSIVALGAAAKLGPAIFGLWLLGRRRWLAFAGFVLVSLTIAGITLALVGAHGVVEYLRVSQNASDYPTGTSPVAAALALGVPRTVAAAIPEVLVVASFVVTLLLPSRPRLTFAVVAAASVVASPLVRIDAYGLLAMCAIPWMFSEAGAERRFHSRPIPLLTALAVLVVAPLMASLIAARPEQTHLALRNASTQTLVVRFSSVADPATWGYELEPGEAGAAWHDTWGTVRQPITVFDADCRPLEKVSMPSGGGFLRLLDSGAEILSQAIPEGPLLPYSSRCAGVHP